MQFCYFHFYRTAEPGYNIVTFNSIERRSRDTILLLLILWNYGAGKRYCWFYSIGRQSRETILILLILYYSRAGENSVTFDSMERQGRVTGDNFI